MNIEYKNINGTSYHKDTNNEVVNVLESARLNNNRIILDYGDVTTGKSWNEENDIRGTIGRSNGTYKVPLLIKTTRSYGGGAILDNCILKITDAKSRRILYKHSLYHSDI